MVIINKGMTKKDVELFPVDNLSYKSDNSFFLSSEEEAGSIDGELIRIY
jgi:hypothetical protein